MRRFFYTHPTASAIKPLADYHIGEELTLTEGIYHHWCKVLRAKVGDNGILFDGFGGERHVTLTTIDKKTATVQCGQHHHIDRIAPVSTHIALVISRGERMDYAIQKASELGVTSIQLLTSQHGEVRLKPAQIAKKLIHWQQVALSSCEQCGLNRPPIIYSPIDIQEFLNFETDVAADVLGKPCELVSDLLDNDFYQPCLPEATTNHLGFLKLVLAVPPEKSYSEYADLDDQTANSTANNIDNFKIGALAHIKHHLESHANNHSVENRAKIWLLIGAEGGLSDNEVQASIDAGFIPWQIGERVLRTETAPVVALSTLWTLFIMINS